MVDSSTSRHGKISVPPLVNVDSADSQAQAEVINKLKVKAAPDDARFLENVPLFQGLSSHDMAALFSHSVVRTHKKNTVVIHEGDNSDSLYVILTGRVRVYLSDEEGKEVDLNILGAGEYFGELAAIDNFPRSASVVTLAECRFSVVSKKEFDSCLTKNPQIAVRIIDELSTRFRSMTENVKSLALMDVYGRVARTLINLAAESDEGKLVIKQKLTQQDLANMVGASREMVSRILKDLTRGGYITVKNKYITIQEKLPHAW